VSAPGKWLHSVCVAATRSTDGLVAGRVWSLFIERQRHAVISQRRVHHTPLVSNVQQQTTRQPCGRHFYRLLRPQIPYCIGSEIIGTSLHSSQKLHAPEISNWKLKTLQKNNNNVNNLQWIFISYLLAIGVGRYRHFSTFRLPGNYPVFRIVSHYLFKLDNVSEVR